jgi:cell division protein FtsI/penicillin-binding protein 2
MRPIARKRKYAIGSRCNLNGGGDERSHFRINTLAFFILAAIAAIVGRLYVLQVMDFASYRALAEGQHTLFRELAPKRGEIYLRDKSGLYPAAVNKEVKMAYAVPKEIENVREAAGRVSEILQLDKNELENKLDQPEDMYEVLKRRLTEEEAEKIGNSKLKGIHLADEFYRYYPSGELAANVLGFVGWKDNSLGGRYGIEAYFNEELQGKAGGLSQNRDAAGGWISTRTRKIEPAQNGSALILTLDHIVQYETEKILKSAVEKHQADGGSIIVMEPETGKILAMASSPSFDPNQYSQVEDIDAFRNPSASDAYESGSVFKAVTIASGLDSNRISPDTTYVDKGIVQEAGYSIENSDLKSYGLQTMTQVLEKSLNTGVIHVEKLLGNKNFADYVRRFGFGEKTGVDLLGESAGNINNLKNLKSDIQFFTASFGQGISVTPIQLLSAYSVIANGGVLMKPQIIDRIVHPDGAEEKIAPQEVRRVISQKAAQETAQMLRSVVVDGHGKRADVPGYLVAGKTGTAQVASSDKRGYEESETIGSFAGFAPLDNPQFAILVKIDHPKDVQWAESSAAPTFGELMKFLLEYYNVEPTEEFKKADLDKFDATHNLKEFFLKKTEEQLEQAEKDKIEEEKNNQDDKKRKT